MYYSPYASYEPGHGADIKTHCGFLGLGTCWVFAPAPSTFTANYDEWHPTSRYVCPSTGDTVPKRVTNGVYGGHRITTLAAWSVARSAPFLFLKQSPSWANNVSYILLFDPGDHKEFEEGACGWSSLSAQLATWLAARPGNRLAVLAGAVTASDHHAGIQDYLFPAVKNPHNDPSGRDIRAQVVVCNYEGMGHEDLWMKYRGWMNNPPITRSSCPGWSGHKVVSWSP